ncbi:MAG TPA: hypothetical protein VKE40_10355 [Gemmataceae bacterium]|nr:hypothetical protein [Gemmataceae bacterium]
MVSTSINLVPASSRPRRLLLCVLAGVAVGGAGVLTALGSVGGHLPPSVGLPTVPGLLFGSPVLFPAALAAVGLAAAGSAVRSRGRWAAPVSVVGLAAVLLAEATVAWSSANLLIMYQESLYRQIMAGGPAAG